MRSFVAGLLAVSTLFTSTFAAAVQKRNGAGSNLAVYYGQGNSQRPLEDFCNDDTLDIIPIGFVTAFPGMPNAVNGYPVMNFGSMCDADEYWTDPKKGATKMFHNCKRLIKGISACQAKGKKVLLSLGGRDSVWFKDDTTASNFADFIWGAVGPYSSSWNGPRPFGNDIEVDGFDFDIETQQYNSPVPVNTGIATAAGRFRQLWGSKQRMLTAAPQCIVSDPPLKDVLSKVPFDALFIQFYNTPQCSAMSSFDKSSGGDISYDDWVSQLKRTSVNKNIKAYIGLPAAPLAANPGYYLEPSETMQLIERFRSNSMFGGVMLWEMTWSDGNRDSQGNSYAQIVKMMLKGQWPPKSTTTTTTATTTTTTTTTATTKTTAKSTTTTSKSTTTSTTTASTRPSMTTPKSTTTFSSSATSTTSPSSSGGPTITSTAAGTSSSSTATVGSSSTVKTSTSSSSDTTSSVKKSPTLSTTSSTSSDHTSKTGVTTSSEYGQGTSTTTEGTSTSSSGSMTTSGKFTSITSITSESTTTTTREITPTPSSSKAVSPTLLSTTSSTSESSSSLVVGPTLTSSIPTSTEYTSTYTTTTSDSSQISDSKSYTLSSSTLPYSPLSSSTTTPWWENVPTTTTSRQPFPEPTTTYDPTHDTWSPLPTTTTPTDPWISLPTTTIAAPDPWQPVPSVTVTVITTSFINICPTGFTTIPLTTTITYTLTDQDTTPIPTDPVEFIWPTNSAGCPSGFFTTQTICTIGCGEGVRTVTLTLPQPKGIITETVVPVPVPVPTPSSGPDHSDSDTPPPPPADQQHQIDVSSTWAASVSTDVDGEIKPTEVSSTSTLSWINVAGPIATATATATASARDDSMVPSDSTAPTPKLSPPPSSSSDTTTTGGLSPVKQFKGAAAGPVQVSVMTVLVGICMSMMVV